MSGFPERYDDLGTDLANFLDEMLFAVSEEWIQKFLNSYAAFLRDLDRSK